MSVTFCCVTCYMHSSCYFLSCFTFVSIASTYRFQSAVMILVMLFCVLPFGLKCLFLPIYASSKTAVNVVTFCCCHWVIPILSWFLQRTSPTHKMIYYLDDSVIIGHLHTSLFQLCSCIFDLFEVH